MHARPRTSIQGRRSRVCRCARGFTLIESLVAITILGTIMLAVVAALSASQGVAFDGQKRILASIACDDFLSELATLSYDDLPPQNGLTQDIGEMATLDGFEYPTSFWAIGRSVAVEQSTMTDDESGAEVQGLLVSVAGFDETATLMTVQLFVADPDVEPEAEPEEEEEEEEESGGGVSKVGGGLGGLFP